MTGFERWGLPEASPPPAAPPPPSRPHNAPDMTKLDRQATATEYYLSTKDGRHEVLDLGWRRIVLKATGLTGSEAEAVWARCEERARAIEVELGLPDASTYPTDTRREEFGQPQICGGCAGEFPSLHALNIHHSFCNFIGG